MASCQRREKQCKEWKRGRRRKRDGRKRGTGRQTGRRNTPSFAHDLNPAVVSGFVLMSRKPKYGQKGNPNKEEGARRKWRRSRSSASCLSPFRLSQCPSFGLFVSLLPFSIVGRIFAHPAACSLALQFLGTFFLHCCLPSSFFPALSSSPYLFLSRLSLVSSSLCDYLLVPHDRRPLSHLVRCFNMNARDLVRLFFMPILSVCLCR